jgi:hypothetical protein
MAWNHDRAVPLICDLDGASHDSATTATMMTQLPPKLAETP